MDDLIQRRIIDKLMLLWELNPEWRVGQMVDNVFFTANVIGNPGSPYEMSDEDLEEAVDDMLEKSRKQRG